MASGGASYGTFGAVQTGPHDLLSERYRSAMAERYTCLVRRCRSVVASAVPARIRSERVASESPEARASGGLWCSLPMITRRLRGFCLQKIQLKVGLGFVR